MTKQTMTHARLCARLYREATAAGVPLTKGWQDRVAAASRKHDMPSRMLIPSVQDGPWSDEGSLVPRWAWDAL